MEQGCINDLCLDIVFKDYSDSVQVYIQTSSKDEHIVDSNLLKISGFVTDTFGRDEDDAQKYFEVENPSKTEYALLQIDNGIIKTEKTKKCDCAIANAKELCLIEFKANAYSNNLATIQNNYSNAINQLSVTLNIFKSGLSTQGKQLSDLRNVEAYICFKKGYPHTTASQMNYRTAFAEENEGVPLFFKGLKILI